MPTASYRCVEGYPIFNKQLLRSPRHPVERVDEGMHLCRAVERACLTAVAERSIQGWLSTGELQIPR
jgi:hypothetical protein